MNPKELFYFAAQCLALDEHPGFRETIISRFSSGEVALDDFIFLCSNELVLPAIYLNFKKYDLLDLFPDDYRNQIREIYERNKKRNFEILQQADEINLVLAQENINPVYLKGTANLMDNVYSDAGERMIGDIDLLVQENDYLKTADLIKQLGYRTDEKVFGDVKTAKHYPRLFRAGGPADIEIHRVPVNIEYSKQFSSALLFQYNKPVPGMINCFVPSDIHKAVHNFIHAQLSNLGHSFVQSGLRDLYDMYLLSKRTETISIISAAEEKRKLTTYIALTSHIFRSNNFQEIPDSKTSLRYIHLHDWFLDHYSWHRGYVITVKLVEVLFVRFLRGLGKIFSLKSWGNFFKYITAADWYRWIGYRIRNFYGNYISGN